MNNIIKSIVYVLLLIAGNALANEVNDRIGVAMTADSRPSGDSDRDAARKPIQVLSMGGLISGSTVIDAMASDGYYTELLAAGVGSSGKVYAHNLPRWLVIRDGAFAKAMDARLANNRLANVEHYVREMDDLGLEGQVDFIFFGQNLHDLYNRFGKEAAVTALQRLKTTLKSGGVLLLTDHVGVAGQDNNALHRIEVSAAVDSLKSAGFNVEVVNEDILNNPADDHTKIVFDKSLARNTDRFVVKAINP